MLTACGLGSNETSHLNVTPPPVVAGNFCAIYVPVYTSKKDTEETLKKIDKNNAVWLELCKK